MDVFDADSPIHVGLAMGILLGNLNRFVFAMDLLLLATGFVVVGITLALYGEGFWPDVGRTLTVVGLSSVVLFRILMIVTA